ncbi:MAG: DUF1223 domain-containing protein [Pseudomonadota bacterium]|nr:DUF1223 domain-containing protein [Pseudomonadota bacterium]
MMWPNRIAFPLGLLGALAALCVADGAQAQTATPGKPVVVELFTSQGCSSCPPADALLGELTRLPNVIALAFHVDYWDSIGWRDRYEIPTAAKRQVRYVDTLNLSSAFTPQVVIDGKASYVGSDRRRILSAVAERQEDVPVVIEVSPTELSISLPERPTQGTYDVNVVAYLSEATTAIGRGENSGRTLTEFNIVREFRRVAAWDGKPNTLRLPLASFPADATQVAVLLQRSNQGGIIGSAVATLRLAPALVTQKK